MGILTILQEGASERAAEWVKKLTIEASKHHWIGQIDKLLSNLPNQQIDLVKEKFSNLKDTDQLIDKLIEIIVATKFSKQRPRFSSERTSAPDIFLEQDQSFIEVKHLNHSEYEKWLLDGTQTNGILEGQSRLDSPRQQRLNCEESYRGLITKAQDLIDKAITQLLEKEGFIYFVYDRDILTQLDCPDRSKELEKDIFLYSHENGRCIKIEKMNTLLDR